MKSPPLVSRDVAIRQGYVTFVRWSLAGESMSLWVDFEFMVWLHFLFSVCFLCKNEMGSIYFLSPRQDSLSHYHVFCGMMAYVKNKPFLL